MTLSLPHTAKPARAQSVMARCALELAGQWAPGNFEVMKADMLRMRATTTFCFYELEKEYPRV